MDTLSLRRQLPAWSPLGAGALAAGVAAWARGAAVLDRLRTVIRRELGSAEVGLCDSGTTALALALLASARGAPRPRVALPAYGCFDLMTAADAVDAEVVLYDLDPATLSPDADSLRRAVSAGPHAVVVAHWYGLPVALTPARELCQSVGALLIEDAAQGVGASIAGSPAGSLGAFGILSFGRGKGRTGGHGGAVLARTSDGAALLAKVLEHLRSANRGLGDFLRLTGQWMLGRPWLYAIPASLPLLRLGETIYRTPSPLRGMSPMAAGVVEEVWGWSEREALVRETNAHRWRSVLTPAPDLLMYSTPQQSRAGWLRFPVRAERSMRAALSSRRARHAGAMPGYPSPLHALTVASNRWLGSSGSFSGAAELSQSLFTLPTHSLVAHRDVESIARALSLR